VDEVNSPVHRLLPRVMRRSGLDNDHATAARSGTDPLVRYPRLLAAVWRERKDDVTSLLREHAGNAFGVRALGYYCLDHAEDPATALRVAWQLSNAEEYDLALQLYSELNKAGHVVGKELTKMASAYHHAHADEEGIEIATRLVQEALKSPRTDGPSSYDRTPTPDEIEALAYSRLGSLLQRQWELSEDERHFREAIKAYTRARDAMEKTRRSGHFPYPGMIAHTLLKLLVLNRLSRADATHLRRAATDSDVSREAVLRIHEDRDDDTVSVSYLHWAQAIVLADMGEERKASEKVAKRLEDDAKLRGTSGALEIGGRQYHTLLQFLERYEDVFANRTMIEQIAQQLSLRIRSA
jgi:tetratricopeptide (TPR) repeat protein